MESYSKALQETKGVIAEFVNPKYKDSSKTEFKSPTRLECMMQDFPRALPPSANIGFTVINQVLRIPHRMISSRVVPGSVRTSQRISPTCKCNLR